MKQNGHLNKTSLFSPYSEGKAGRSAAVDLKEKVKQIVVIKDMSQLHSKMQLTLLLSTIPMKVVTFTVTAFNAVDSTSLQFIYTVRKKIICLENNTKNSASEKSPAKGFCGNFVPVRGTPPSLLG
jgi:hypothetical protein